MLELIGATVIALIFVWLLPVILIAIFTVPMAVAAHTSGSGCQTGEGVASNGT